jgi:hypothetical protein
MPAYSDSTGSSQAAVITHDPAADALWQGRCTCELHVCDVALWLRTSSPLLHPWNVSGCYLRHHDAEALCSLALLQTMQDGARMQWSPPCLACRPLPGCFFWSVTWGGGIFLAGHTRFSQVNPTAGGRRHCLTNKTRHTPNTRRCPAPGLKSKGVEPSQKKVGTLTPPWCATAHDHHACSTHPTDFVSRPNKGISTPFSVPIRK